MTSPVRPNTVPPEAQWNPSDKEWELGQKNPQGQKIGEWKWWLAPKGHLCCHTFYDDQGQLVRFTRFHPNGEVSREGTYDKGKMVTDIAYRSTEETTEVFPHVVKLPVWKAVMRPGFPVSYDFYDKDGKHLNPQIKPSTLPVKSEDQTALQKEIKTILYKNGQSFLKGEIKEPFLPKVFELLDLRNEQDYEDALTSYADTLADIGYDYVYIKGDLKVKTLNCLEEIGVAALVIEGNLEVEESISLVDDPVQFLLVTGNVTAKNVVTAGFFMVNGNLKVKSCLLGSYNMGSARVLGNLETRFFFPENYFFGAYGDVKIQDAFGNSLRLNLGDLPNLFNYNNVAAGDFFKILHSNIVNNIDLNTTNYLSEKCGDGTVWKYIDYRQFLNYVRQGRPVFADE